MKRVEDWMMKQCKEWCAELLPVERLVLVRARVRADSSCTTVIRSYRTNCIYIFIDLTCEVGVAKTFPEQAEVEHVSLPFTMDPEEFADLTEARRLFADRANKALDELKRAVSPHDNGAALVLGA